jgi:hypothetical protein
MPDTIGVRGLDDKDIALLQHLADTLRSRAQSGRKADKVTEPEEVLVFATHHSDVIGSLTREEIYEDL